MAPRKEKTIAGSSKAAGKRPRTESEEDTPVNRNLFRDSERQRRYETIRDWSFITERRVILSPGEFSQFTDEIQRRRWMQLAEPMIKFDPDVVKEFYANAWPTEVGKLDKRSKVRGCWIPYHRDAINDLLGNPMTLREGQLSTYQRMRQEIGGFCDLRVARTICLPGRSYESNQAGKPLRILRGNMKSLTQMWMSFMLANIVPILHSSDLNMPRCYLLYCIMANLDIDIATVISEEIHQFVISEPSRHQERLNKPLGFPALITALCAAHGVNTAPSKSIRPPIDKKFIEKYCLTREDLQGDAEQPVEHPMADPSQPGPSVSSSPSSIMDYFQKLELHMHHIEEQQAANHRGQLLLNQSFYTLTQNMQNQVPYTWPTPEQFAIHVGWPGDRPSFQGRAGAAGMGSSMGGEAEGTAAGGEGREQEEDADLHNPLDDIIGGD